MRSASRGPGRNKSIDQPAQARAFRFQVSFILYDKYLCRRRIPAQRFVVSHHFRLHYRPKDPPDEHARRLLVPSAVSTPREQCSSACAGFIVPHCRTLSGLNCAIRCFTSSTLAASNRFFIRNALPNQLLTTKWRLADPPRIAALFTSAVPHTPIWRVGSPTLSFTSATPPQPSPPPPGAPYPASPAAGRLYARFLNTRLHTLSVEKLLP